MSALGHVLATAPPEPPRTLEAWWRGHRALPWSTSWEVALAGGWAAGGMGYAFASGYQAAAAALFADRDEIWALCATEAGGNHPRAIETRLQAGRLFGEKTFVTLGEAATRLAVVCHEGEAEGRKRLRVALVAAERADIQPLPPLPLVPEIGHARCRFDGVEPDEVLEGDGYLRVLKPFRTIEDLHVHLAFCGLLLRHVEGRDDRARIAAQVVALAALTERDPLDPETHVALGGLLGSGLEHLGPAIPHWERDGALLKVASKARARRLERAWEVLQTSS